MLTCPVCGKSAKKWRMYSRRENARCTHCQSLERHRAVAMIVRAVTEAYNPHVPLRVLHVRPGLEMALAKSIVRPANNNTALKRHVNVLNLPFTDGSVDLAIHNHIMEHVRDDRRGFREFKRVLSPDGVMVFTVPAWGKEHLEGIDDGSAASRLKHYGQKDHVRLYSQASCIERLLECGFTEAAYVGVGAHYDDAAIAAAALGPAYGAFVAR